MKKLTLTFSFIAITILSIIAQNFGEAGLKWSKDCTTDKPFKEIRFYTGGSPITSGKINTSLGLDVQNPGDIRELIIPNGIFVVNEPVDIPSNVLLKGSGNTEIHIVTELTAGLRINGDNPGYGSNSGIENLNITNLVVGNCCDGDIGSNLYSIRLNNATNCWVKGVKSYYGGANGHIQIEAGNNNEVSGCFITDNRCASNRGGGRAYGINIVDSDKNLISHNILSTLRHHILLNGTSKNNVIVYNKTSNTVFRNWAIQFDCEVCENWPWWWRPSYCWLHQLQLIYL